MEGGVYHYQYKTSDPPKLVLRGIYIHAPPSLAPNTLGGGGVGGRGGGWHGYC